MLRDYQRRALDQLYEWMRQHDGNPCLVLPTGAGKSHVVAALCREAVQTWPETRILMLTHQKELIAQNAEKLRQHWPGAPLGIYSASLSRRQLGEPITFAGIQSVRNRADEIGHVDLIVIDECHLVSHRDEGGYRRLIAALRDINSAVRVVGLTATPYRSGHGLITDAPAIFDDLLEPVSIEQLIDLGHLSRLRSKVTAERLDVTGVHRRGGDYIESELQAAVDTDDQNRAVVAEVLRLAAGRRSWLFFCSGVAHAEHIAEILRESGIVAECVTGATPPAQRDRMLQDFKSEKITALTNANVLTTGFDAPCIDVIAMLRPTMSASLYVQMAGRGLRIAPGKSDCLVLDFAGVVERHGPITCVQPPTRSGEGGEAPVKACPDCGELVHASVHTCPACAYQWPPPEAAPKPLMLRADDIMGLEGQRMPVTRWSWRRHTSRTSGLDMLSVTYYGALSDAPVTEYLPVLHTGYAGSRAMRQLLSMAESAGASLASAAGLAGSEGLPVLAELMTRANPPQFIEYRKEGKFFRVLHRSWT